MGPNIDEALRYAGVSAPAPETLRREMEAIAVRLDGKVRPRYTWRAFPIDRSEGALLLQGSGVTLTGRMAAQMLERCDQAVLLACTIGEGFDAMLRTEQARDMAKAVMMDACGSAWVESVCDEAEREISARFPDLYLTDRFSPGYGDLPLALQPAICAALDTPRRVGVHVTQSLLLNPAKSVTAIVGLSDRPQSAKIRGCAYCSLRETCTIRKGGSTCAF